MDIDSTQDIGENENPGSDDSDAVIEKKASVGGADAPEEAQSDLAQLLEEHDFDLPRVGDIRTGIVVSMTSQGVIVDLGLKRDGLVPPSDLEELDEETRETIQLNEEVPVYIMETSQPDRLLVSIHKARLNQDWIQAEELLESGDVFEAEVIGYNRGGIIIPFGNLRGFVPASHLSELRRGMDERQRQQAMAKLRGEEIPLKVIEVNRRRRRLVLSQRDAQKEWQETRKLALIAQLNEGDVVSGRVSGLRNFGAFVDLGGADGLVHISELAWHRVNHPREVLRVGDEIEVKILNLDKERQRIALSLKDLLPNPWSLADEKYREGQLVEGTITRIVDYGAFVEIEPGIEGLLHISQLSRDNVENPREFVKEGETHLLRIVSIDSRRQRIGLSLKSVTASEQIEWMTRIEMEKAAREEERAAAEAAAAADKQRDIEAESDGQPEVEGAEEPETEAEAVEQLEVEADEQLEEAEVEVEAEVGEQPEAEAEAAEQLEGETDEKLEEAEVEAEVEVGEQPEADAETAEQQEIEVEVGETSEPALTSDEAQEPLAVEAVGDDGGDDDTAAEVEVPADSEPPSTEDEVESDQAESEETDEDEAVAEPVDPEPTPAEETAEIDADSEEDVSATEDEAEA